MVLRRAGWYAVLLLLALVGVAETQPAIQGYTTIQDEGSNLTRRRLLDFRGAGVSCADDSATSSTRCTITSGGGGAPDDAVYVVGSAHAGLSAERVVTDTATIAWDQGTAAQMKANVPDAAIAYAKIQNGGALSVAGRAANSAGVMADVSASAASGAVLRESGSTIGFGTVATAGIADTAVTSAKLRDSAALTVIGRSANSSGVPADIAASAASGAVLRESGSTIGFGTVATAGIADAAITYAKVQNVTDARLLGRSSGSSGPPIEITVGSGLSLSAGALTATGSGGARYFFTGISSVSITASTTCASMGEVVCGAAALSKQNIIPATGTLKNLRFSMSATQGTSDSCKLEVGVGADMATLASATAITCSIGDTQHSCTDLVNTVAVTAGNSVNLIFTEVAATCIGFLLWSFELTPS